MTKKASILRSIVAVFGVASIVLSPLGVSAATNTASTTVNVNVASTISISSSNNVSLNITPVAGGSQTSASDTVTVNTNSSTGYNLMLKDADATLTLTNGGQSIAASSNTMAAATTLANNTWGFAVASSTPGVAANTFDASYSAISNQTSSSSKWAGITASDQRIKQTSEPASNDTTTVWYSAKVDTSKPSGTYTDVVTYTATTN